MTCMYIGHSTCTRRYQFLYTFSFVVENCLCQIRTPYCTHILLTNRMMTLIMSRKIRNSLGSNCPNVIETNVKQGIIVMECLLDYLAPKNMFTLQSQLKPTYTYCSCSLSSHSANQLPPTKKSFFFSFLAFDFCRFCVVIPGFFSSPPQRPMTSDFEVFSIPDFIHYIYFPFLIL